MERDSDAIARHLISETAGCIFAGPSGNGKTGLARSVAEALAAETGRARLLEADPGTPAFGPPGAVSSVRLDGENWIVENTAGLATLDAGRFRLPLTAATRRLADGLDAPLLVDAPGLSRGTPATELIPALADASGVEMALVVGADDAHAELAAAVAATGVEVEFVEPADGAESRSLDQKARDRTRRWDQYLEGAQSHRFPLGRVDVVGTHPPLDTREAWPGRQVALLDDRGCTLGLGEVRSIEADGVAVRTPVAEPDAVGVLLARDARRNDAGRLRTDPPGGTDSDSTELAGSPFTLRDSPNERAGISGTLTLRVGMFRALFVGGFFDDPTVLLDHVQRRRALLVDLGEVDRYPVRVLNKVSDVLVTHAHTDHFSGFVRLIRTRVHGDRRCRVFGPRGLADRVEALVDGFTWDRLGDGEGPVFEVAELHDERLRRWEIRAAEPRRRELDSRPAPGGRLLREARFEVRARELDHGTPVLAFRVEENENYSVRSDRLEPPYEPGPWLGELKRKYADRRFDDTVELPDGSTESVEALADRLLVAHPGESFVYATDFADTAENRRRAVELANGADVFVCEAFYARDEAEEAAAYGHLTTSTTARLAREADVGRLVPFHFSARYESEPERIYGEILETFERVEVPESVARRLSERSPNRSN